METLVLPNITDDYVRRMERALPLLKPTTMAVKTIAAEVGLPDLHFFNKTIRAATGLSQSKFAELLSIEVSTLRNWEQARRDPTGPARALLRAIRNDPVAVIRALTD